MALSTARIHRVRGRPPLLAAGIISLIHSHSSSVRSLGYIFSFIYPFYTTHEDFSDRLLALSVVICCVMYPLVLWGIGQTVFPFQANGSMLQGPDGTPVGSQLIAQPFTKDEYFQPRPSAASYDASASASSALAPSNYALRDRVARTI